MRPKEAPQEDPVVQEALARELVGRLEWMNRLRLLAGAALLAGGLLPADWQPILPRLPLRWLGLWVLGLGAFHAWALRRRLPRGDGRALRTWIRLEFLLDWLALVGLLYWTGGIFSPWMVFFAFHAILAAMLLPRRDGFLQCLLALGLVAALALASLSGLPKPPLPPHLGEPIAPDLPATAIRLAFFGTGLFGTFFLTHSIAGPLWSRTWERLSRQQRIQIATRRLEVLQKVSRILVQDLALSRVLQALAEATIRFQGAAAATLRLWDEDAGLFRLAARAGALTDASIPPEVHLTDSPLEREVLQGRSTVSGVLLPEPGTYAILASYGFRSMVDVPVKHQGRVFGVLRVFFDRAVEISPEELAWLEALGEAGGAAIRNADSYDALKALEEAKSRYVFHLAHQLKSPLSAVRSALSLLEEGFEGDLPDDLRARLRDIRLHAASLQALINNLMALGSLQDSDTRGPPEVLDLPEVVAEVWSNLRSDALDLGLSFHLETPASPVACLVSPDDLRGALTQVLDNAIRYQKPGGAIDVRFALEGPWAFVDVVDRGIGIPPEEQGGLFREFFRASNARNHAPGTGLGLVLARRLLQRNEGKIEVRSPAPDLGEGTAVRIQVPALCQEEER